MGADPDIYLARVHWSADGDTLYVERENRDQTRLDMLVDDPATGTSRVLFSEKSGPKSWLNLSHSFKHRTSVGDGKRVCARRRLRELCSLKNKNKDIRKKK